MARRSGCPGTLYPHTQPWRFHYAAGTFELRADTSRGLGASDPDGRELVISCGAALYNLRIAARKLGYTATVTLFPEPLNPRLLARIDVVESHPAVTAERRAYEAST